MCVRAGDALWRRCRCPDGNREAALGVKGATEPTDPSISAENPVRSLSW